jgi:hypothetical protein
MFIDDGKKFYSVFTRCGTLSPGTGIVIDTSGGRTSNS